MLCGYVCINEIGEKCRHWEMRESQWICENHQAKVVEKHIDGKGSYVMVYSYIIPPKSSYLYRHHGDFWQHNFCLVLVS